MSNAARIEELQKKFDENPRRYFAPLANECRKAGDLDAAIAICRAHLPQQPGHMSGHIVYGQALFEAGELDEARTVFETALGLDPENLIALRHMGEIAARHGDLDAARQWYRRVLDTDPRNEEIQELLAALGSTDTESGAPAEPAELPTLMEPALVAAAADAATEPVSSDEQFAAVPGLEELPVADEVEPTPELLDLEPTSFGDAPALDWGGEVPPAVEPAPGLEREETLVAESFTLDGFEATSFDAPPAEDIATESAVEPQPERDAIEPPAADFEPLDLDITGFGATGLEPTGLSIPEPAHRAPAPAAAEPSDDEAGAGESVAFVTETMAELYLQQGYPDRALDVYRQLVAQSPHDAGLRERMARVEREGATAVADTFAVEEVGRERAVPTGRGPTIREFLAALATGQPVPSASADEGAVEQGSVEEGAAEVAAAPVPRPGGEIAEVVSVADAAHAQEASRLDAIFGAPDRGEDVRAADAIAGAYAAGPEAPATTDAATNPLSGRPARPAGNDLSLDHVFGQPRQSGGTPRPTGSFSFDQFFAEGAVRPSHEEPREPEADAGGDEDLAQFNDWLKGLKNQ